MPKKKKILFYCATSPTVLIYKIAYLLKKHNYETILFANCEKEVFDYNFYKGAFDKIIVSNFSFNKLKLKNTKYILKRGLNLLKFLFLLKTTKPYAVIGVSGNNFQLKFVYKYFLKKHPFIYFPYDILGHFFSSKENALKSDLAPEFKELEAEKYLFENSDGILHKGSPGR